MKPFRPFALGATLIACASALAGCGGGGTGAGASSTPVVIATPYSSSSAVAYGGTASDAIFGTGMFSMAFAQSGSQVTGTWGVVYTGSNAWFNGGSFSGTLTGNTLSGSAISDIGECTLTVNATLSGSTYTGTYVGLGSCSNDTANFSAAQFTIPQLAPTYSGTVTNSLVPAGGTMSLSLAQYNVYLTGDYSDTFGTAPAYGNSGQQAFGVVTGPSSVGYYLFPTSPTQGGCALVLSGSLSGAVLSGQYYGQDCSPDETGAFNL